MSKGKETRQRIIELAAPLFNRQGYAGCSMADIMEATGLEKGGIYRYFESKEALAIEAFRFALGQTRKLHTHDLADTSGALARLHAVIDRFVSEPSPMEGGCPLMNTAVDTDDSNAALRELAHRAFVEWRSRLAAIVREGIAKREIGGPCDPAELADTMVAALEGALVLSRLDGNKRALQHARQSLHR